MTPKTLLILFATLTVLVAAYLFLPENRITTDHSQDPQLRRGDRVFPGFRVEDARAVEIQQGNVQVRLEKSGADRWVVANRDNRIVILPKIKKLLAEVGAAQVRDNRKGPLDKFSLDPTNRIRLTALGKSDKMLATAEIGSSPQYETCFARLPEQEGVLEISPDLESTVGARTRNDRRVLTVDHWYDLTILRIDRDRIQEIEIHSAQKPIRLKKLKTEKKDGEPKEKKEKPKWTWRIVEPIKADADENACNAICATASIFFAKGYADDVKPEERGLDRPSARTHIKLDDGTTYTFVFGKVASDFAVMCMEGKPEVWKVERYNYEGLVKDLNELKRDASSRGTPRAPGSEKPAEPRKPVSQPLRPGTKPETSAPKVPEKVKETPKPKPPPTRISP